MRLENTDNYPCRCYLAAESQFMRELVRSGRIANPDDDCCLVPGQMPEQGQRFSKRASIALPAVGVETTVLDVFVPIGYDGRIETVVNLCNSTTFIDSTGWLTWRIKQGRRYIADYGEIIDQLGDLRTPYALEGAGIALVSGQHLLYTVTLSLAGQGAIDPAAKITCALNGWWTPRRRRNEVKQ